MIRKQGHRRRCSGFRSVTGVTEFLCPGRVRREDRVNPEDDGDLDHGSNGYLEA